MKDKILVIDDDIMNIKTVQQILKEQYQVATATSGEMALKILEQMIPDLVLMDINMPGMDGFELLERFKKKEETATIPVIFVTADQSELAETRALEAGAVDFVSRPFNPSVLMKRITNTLQMEHYKNKLESMVKEQASEIISHVEKLNKLQKEVIISMANLIESRDGSTGGHVKRTGLYVELLVKALMRRKMYSDILTPKFAEDLCNAAYMHDIGKIKVSDSILQKPGKLTQEEYEKMKEHASNGGAIIRSILAGIEDESYIKMAEEVSMYHHEKWDGTGYPEGLRETQIPLSARIMAIADVFDALTSKRCYKEAMEEEEALDVMKKMSGTYFDPDIIDVFFDHFTELKRISRSYQ